jgi:hypothetical protein
MEETEGSKGVQNKPIRTNVGKSKWGDLPNHFLERVPGTITFRPRGAGNKGRRA